MGILFDIEEKPGTWFPFQTSTVKPDGEVEFDSPEPDAPEFCIRQAEADFFKNLHKKTRKKMVEQVWDPKTRRPHRQEFYDQTQEQLEQEIEAIWDHTITDWRGVLDKDGKAIPCTKDAKVKLLDRVPAVHRFYQHCLKILGEESGVLRQEENENL
jgi:hypothetical protein